MVYVDSVGVELNYGQEKLKAREFVVGGVAIGDREKCFVIAEIGHNHQGSIETAKQMIKAAVDSGATAVKLQKRSNKSLFTKRYFDRPYDSENSFGSTYGEHRENLEFNEDQYRALQVFSADLGVILFATAFDFESADFLEALNVPAFKLASGDLKNTPLIKYLATFRKPIFLSTGGGTLDDVDRAIDLLETMDTPYCLMQCTAGYPPSWNELNLNVISEFRVRYSSAVIGFSSHDNGIAMAVAAYALGSRVIEKHFTLNRTMKGTDHAFSLEPQGLRKMVRDLDRLHLAMGDGVKRQFESEVDPLQKMGKKIVLNKFLLAGSVIRESDIAFRSPGDGLPPYLVAQIVGKVLMRDLVEDETINLVDVR